MINEFESNSENNIKELTEFFDLLAKFDFEDKKKSEINTDSLDSAPKESVLGSDYK